MNRLSITLWLPLNAFTGYYRPPVFMGRLSPVQINLYEGIVLRSELTLGLLFRFEFCNRTLNEENLRDFFSPSKKQPNKTRLIRNQKKLCSVLYSLKK